MGERYDHGEQLKRLHRIWHVTGEAGEQHTRAVLRARTPSRTDHLADKSRGPCTGWLGLLGTALALASIFWIMPVGKGSLRAALWGGTIAAVFWQALQGMLSWYFANSSSVNLIYGSLAGIVVVLFSFELAAAIVLLAAQAIAELERSRSAGLRWYEAPPSRAPGGAT